MWACLLITFLALLVSANGQFQRLFWWGRGKGKEKNSSFCKFGAVLLYLRLSNKQKAESLAWAFIKILLDLQKRTGSELSWHWGGVCRNLSPDRRIISGPHPSNTWVTIQLQGEHAGKKKSRLQVFSLTEKQKFLLQNPETSKTGISLEFEWTILDIFLYSAQG